MFLRELNNCLEYSKVFFIQMIYNSISLILSPRCPIFHIDKANDDGPVHGNGWDGEGGDDNEDGLERGLEVAQEGGVAPVPPLVHNLHLGKQELTQQYQ